MRLNLPQFDIKIKKTKNDAYQIFDIIRRKHLMLTPEEWVRQNFVHYLIYSKGYSRSLIGIEKEHRLHGRIFRTDIVVYDTQSNPLIIVECKAPSIKITEKTFEQISNYNRQFKVKYLVVTNGLDHYICEIKYPEISYKFLKEIPHR